MRTSLLSRIHWWRKYVVKRPILVEEREKLGGERAKRASLDEDEKYIRATTKLTLFSKKIGSLASPLLH